MESSFFIDWKGIIYGIFVFLSQLFTCDSPIQYHQPDTTARIEFIVKVDGCDSNGFNQTQKKLTQRLIKNEVFYQNVISNPEKNEITFSIIGNEVEFQLVPKYRKILSQQVDLQFIPAARISDNNLQSTIDSIIQKENLGQLFTINNISNGHQLMPGGVIGSCASKGKKEEVQNILNKYESTLPVKLIWGVENEVYIKNQKKAIYYLYAYSKEVKQIITEAHILNAKAAPNKYSGTQEINIEFNSTGAKKWAEMTTAAAQDNNREILMILNDEVRSAPRVMSPILGGRSSISGNFSDAEAKEFAALINVGNTPCNLTIISEQVK